MNEWMADGRFREVTRLKKKKEKNEKGDGEEWMNGCIDHRDPSDRQYAATDNLKLIKITEKCRV